MLPFTHQTTSAMFGLPWLLAACLFALTASSCLWLSGEETKTSSFGVVCLAMSRGRLTNACRIVSPRTAVKCFIHQVMCYRLPSDIILLIPSKGSKWMQSLNEQNIYLYRISFKGSFNTILTQIILFFPLEKSINNLIWPERLNRLH